MYEKQQCGSRRRQLLRWLPTPNNVRVIWRGHEVKNPIWRGVMLAWMYFLLFVIAINVVSMIPTLLGY